MIAYISAKIGATNKLLSTDHLHFGQRRGFGPLSGCHQYFFNDPQDTPSQMYSIGKWCSQQTPPPPKCSSSNENFIYDLVHNLETTMDATLEDVLSKAASIDSAITKVEHHYGEVNYDPPILTSPLPISFRSPKSWTRTQSSWRSSRSRLIVQLRS